MKLNNLKPAAGSTHSRRRIGRGPGSGLGGTSTRGHKGAKACSWCAALKPLQGANRNHHELGHFVQRQTPAFSRQFDSAAQILKLCQNLGRQGGCGS